MATVLHAGQDRGPQSRLDEGDRRLLIRRLGDDFGLHPITRQQILPLARAARDQPVSRAT